jgi:hypothetical protein
LIRGRLERRLGRDWRCARVCGRCGESKTNTANDHIVEILVVFNVGIGPVLSILGVILYAAVGT